MSMVIRRVLEPIFAAAAAASSPAALRDPEEGFGSSVRISLYGSSADPSDARAKMAVFEIIPTISAIDNNSASFFLIMAYNLINRISIIYYWFKH